jgi:hypothetical protein
VRVLLVVQVNEVAILSHENSTICIRASQQLGIGGSEKPRFGNGEHVYTAIPKRLGHSVWNVFIELETYVRRVGRA